jgi:hypothetical protein
VKEKSLVHRTLPLALGGLLVLALGCASQVEVTNAPAGGTPSAPAPAPVAPNAAPPSPSVAPEASSAAPSAAPSTSAGAAPVSPSDDAAHASAIDEENVYGPDRTLAAAEVPLLDENKRPLPQTDARPSAQSASFDARMRLLARAITTGDSNAALPAFFPAVAYAQVKDIPQPEKDWEHRLVSAFKRDIAEYRSKLGDDAGKATLVAVEVPENKAKFMKPGSEGNRVGYYRVLRSTLTFKTPNGKQQSFELTSMISWRGEWYVVHLHGFK